MTRHDRNDNQVLLESKVSETLKTSVVVLVGLDLPRFESTEPTSSDRGGGVWTSFGRQYDIQWSLTSYSDPGSVSSRVRNYDIGGVGTQRRRRTTLVTEGISVGLGSPVVSVRHGSCRKRERDMGVTVVPGPGGVTSRREDSGIKCLPLDGESGPLPSVVVRTVEDGHGSESKLGFRKYT